MTMTMGEAYGAEALERAEGTTVTPVPTAPSPATSPVRVAVAVVEPDDHQRERLVALLGSSVSAFSQLDELVGRLSGGIGVVVVLGPSCADEATLSSSARISAQYPNVAAVLVADELTTALLQQALRAGVRDVLTVGNDPTVLAQSVQRVALSFDQVTSPAVPVAVSPEQPEAPVVAPGEDEAPDCKVITVFSTKGGSGKSVLATSLAVALARSTDRPVCLVDADLQFGDVAVMLKLAPRHTTADVLPVVDRLDAPLLDSLLVTHEPTGLKVLPAPLEPAYADQITSAHLTKVIEVLRTFCAYVVVDTPSYFNDVVLGAVEASDKVVLLSGLDVPNIKNLKIGLQTLRLLETPEEKLLLALNRADSKVKLDVGEVERTLQFKASCLIPSDVVVPQSINKGETVITFAPKSGVAKAITQLAESFMPATQRPKKRK
ncbi:MAG: CpaE family protein [Actinomycetes bacterium]